MLSLQQFALFAVLVIVALGQGCDPTALGNCRQLGSVLNCTFLDLTQGPCSIPDGITQLWLDYNNITMFPAALFNFPGYNNLAYLSAFENVITSITVGSFSSLTNLMTLNLGGNLITSLSNSTFQGLASLQYLDLEWNSISFIDLAAFAGLDSLHTLILGGNSITVLASYGLSGASGLFSLDLSDNAITLIQKDAFFNTQNLQQLSLELIGPVAIESLAFNYLPRAKINLRATVITTFQSDSFVHGLNKFICGQDSSSNIMCLGNECETACGVNSTCYLNAILFPTSEFVCCPDGTPCPPNSGMSSTTRFLIYMGAAIVGLWAFVLFVMLIQHIKKKRNFAKESRGSSSERTPLIKT